MSRIKRLKLEGFKSFAKPTILHFEDGFNTIVGANGSGKSNVFDALCFVLGRMSSKGLRADKLGNLVFNGGKGLKPAKQAEVSIYLSNENQELLPIDLEEIKISRIVTSNGQSTYLLNNKKVTRTEIVEVLSRAHIDPDGYNIILQGDIMRIVNMTPIERRQLIEEISNISGYEDKRQKALKKLERIDADLKDADLLMEEKTKYINDLKSEKIQAEKYHATKEELHYRSVLLSRVKQEKNKAQIISKQEEITKYEESLQEYQQLLKEFEEKDDQIAKEIKALEKEIEVTSHSNFIEVTNSITALDAKLLNLKEKKAELTKNKQDVLTRISGLQQNKVSTQKSISTLEKEIDSLKKKEVQIQQKLENLENKISPLKDKLSSGSQKELDEVEEELESLIEKKAQKSLIRQDNAIQVEKLNTKLEHLQSQLDKQLEHLEGNKDQTKQLESLRSELKKKVLLISQTANKHSEISSKISSLQQEYHTLQEKESRLRIKSDASRDLMSSNRAVDAILKLKSADPNIRGSVAELGSVQQKYAQALEAVAGKAMFNIVVSDDNTAVKYINYLKEKKIGSVTFFPLNKIHRKVHLDSSVLTKKGVIDYALSLISYDREYEHIFSLIFGDTLVIESINDAKSIGIGKYKMVTLDGDLVTKTGAMSGGYKAKKSLGAFKDDSCFEELEKISSKLSTLQNTLSVLKSDKEDLEKTLYDARKEKAEIEGEISKIEKVLSITGFDSSALQKEIEAITSDKVVIDTSLKKIDRELKELDEIISSLQTKKQKIKEKTSMDSSLTSLHELQEQRDEIKAEITQIQSEIGQKSIQLTNVFQPELANLEKIEKELNSSLSSLTKTLEEISSQISSHTKELEELKKQEKELSKGYKTIIAKRDQLKEQREKEQHKFDKKIAKFDAIKEKLAQCRYALSEYQTLETTLVEDYKALLSELEFEYLQSDKKDGKEKYDALFEKIEARLSGSSIDVKELQNKVNQLKAKLNSFGSINMKAVEIYDKLHEEFEHLLEKREQLNKERNEILDFVSEMDAKKKERFLETFTTLKEHFQNFYQQLSSKGTADLELEDEEHLFETGVEIKVRLSKRNYLDIKSLSGGEKTITAVAFIFAVQEFNPASFYIFDEIDAALDIMNCEKLGKLIASSADKAQYIVVSHSEYLIQSSQSIYGVTMDEDKISGVVSLDLQNATEYIDDSSEESSS
jgi:chromosome segregation protein